MKNKLIKKAVSVGLSVTTAVWLSGAALLVPVAAAQTTVADLEAQIASLLATITQLQASLATLQGGGAVVSVSCSFSKSLTIGSKGDDVKCLQQFLNSAGHQLAASGAGSPGSETNFFGPLTRAAVASWQAANNVLPSVGFFGPLSRAKFSSLVVGAPAAPGAPSVPGVVIPASGLALSLAVGNPLGVTVPKGATGLELLRFNIAGSGTLDSIVFMRSGIGQTSDFGSSGFYLFEGGTRLTSGRSINSTTHEVGFFSLGLAVSGSVRTLRLVADISSTAQSGNRNAFSLKRAAGSSSPTGSFSGNEMEIGGTGVGQITATSGAAPSNPNVGEAEALLAEFRLEADSTEDIDIIRIALTEGGSLPNDRLSNFKLKQGGNVVASASAIGGKDLIVFEFDSAFLLEKGQQKTFQIFADISGAARSDDKIVFYFDSNSDINAIGRTLGFPVATVITDFDTTGEGDELTIQGGRITITFNGPVAGDVARRLQDVLVFDFTIASENNVEIRNLRFHATTTGIISGEGFNDFKVWDTGSNTVITSATDITATSTDITFTDVINLSAGESKRFKVTVDVDADNDDNDSITVSLLAFQSNDIRNLDNNTFVATSDIVPNSTISGNLQETDVPGVNIQLAGTPTSQTFVRGSQNVDLVGISFRAIADDIRLSSLKITGVATNGTLGTGEVTSLALWDGAVQVSEVESLSSSLTMTFDSSFNFTVKKGETKVLTLRGNLDSNADSGDIYGFRLATTTDLTAFDSDGNSISGSDLSGTAANTSDTVLLTIANVGSVAVTRAADDTDSEAGIILSNGERVLAKFKFESVNEAMTIDKFQIMINPTASSTENSAAAADEITAVKLFEGSTVVGSSAGYPVTASGNDAGVVFIPEGLGWVIPKDGNKTLTVKGVVNTIPLGADTGASVYAHVMVAGFKARGATANFTAITAALGNEKIVYKSKPTVSLPTWTAPSLAAGTNAIFRFTVAASGNDDVSWKKVQLKVTMAGATMSAVEASPGTSGSVQIRDLSTNTVLNIATAFSGALTTSSTQDTITGSNSGFVSMILNAEQTITAGNSKDYEVSLTFANLTSGAGNSSAALLLNLQETSKSAAASFNSVEGTFDGEPSFVWSDNSATSHSETTSDWANGFRVKTLPSTSKTVSN